MTSLEQLNSTELCRSLYDDPEMASTLTQSEINQEAIEKS